MIMTTHKTTLARPLFLALVLGLGFGTVWFVVALWMVFNVASAWPGQEEAAYESLIITRDGTPVIERIPRSDLSRRTYRDLDGNSRDAVNRANEPPASYLSAQVPSDVSLLARVSWQSRMKIFLNERDPGTVWYFVHDGKAEGSGYFMGFEFLSNRRIGFIGLSGSQAQAVPRNDQIPVPYAQMINNELWSSESVAIYSGARYRVSQPNRGDFPPRLVHVPSGSSLRVVDLDERSVRTVFEAPEPILSVAVPMLSANLGIESQHERPLLVRTAQAVYRLDHHYDIISRFVVPPKIGSTGNIVWCELEDGRSVVQSQVNRPESDAEEQGRYGSKLYWLNKESAIEKTRWADYGQGSSTWTDQAQAAAAAVCLPCPAGLLGTGMVLAISNPRPGIWMILARLVRLAWPALVVLLVLTIVLVVVTRRRCRAYGLSARERGIWMAFVLLFGLPAFAGFLLHRRWPVRLACPRCPARCPRDRAECVTCGEPFPAPALRGNEIFA